MPNVNSGSFRPTKAGSPRENGQLPEGNGSLARSSSIAKEGTIGSSKGDVGSMPSTYRPEYVGGSGGKQTFKPTSKGSVR